MVEKPLSAFAKTVLRAFKRIDPNREVIITNPKTVREIVIPESELNTSLNTDHKVKYLLHPLTEPE